MNKVIVLLIAVLMAIPIKTATAKAKRDNISPSMQYEAVQRSLAQGWNTWDVRSVLTHVYLPNALGVDITLEDKNGARATRFRVGDRGGDAPVLHPFAHTADGTYTRIGVKWHDAEFIVESSADSLRNFILVSPVANPNGVKVVVEPKGIWKRGVSVKTDSTLFRLAATHNAVTVNGRVLGRHLTTRGNRIVMDGASDVAVSCNGSDKGIEEIKKLLLETGTEIAKVEKARYGDMYDSYNAMSTALCWNNIYDPQIRRVITPVSRIWSSEWFGSSDFGGFTLFCWDTYLASMMLSAFDKNLAYANAVEMTMALTEQGFVPNCYYSNGFKSRDRSQPPLGSFAIWTLFRQHGDRWVLELVFDNLLKWNTWWTENRTDGGLICPGSTPYEKMTYYRSEYDQNSRYASNLETGLDNSPMYDGVNFDSDTHLLLQQDAGLTSLFIMDCNYLAKIARAIGREKDAKMLEKRSKAYSRNLQSLWNEEKGIFCNRSTVDGKLSNRLSPTLFYAMLAKAATPQQAETMVKTHLLNPDEFWGEYIIPSIARNDPAFKDNEYWRGRIWAPLNFLVYHGLKNYDYPEEARMFAEKSENLLLKSWLEHGYIFENYNAETGQGDDTVRSDKFYHWGALLGYIALIENGLIDIDS